MTDVVKDIANLVTQDLLRIAKAMAEESAKAQQDAIATMGLTNIRGTVVAIDANNKVRIRRSTSLNDDETPGPADPGFYPVASPGVLPQVGDLVWGFANNGGAVIMGKEAAAGYRDIPAVDASVSAVKAGGVDDFSLLNAKYATGSNDARTVQDESLTGAEIQNRGISGSTELATLSVTGGELASRTITASQKIALSSLTDNEVASRTLTGNSIALENVGNAEVSDGSMRTNEIANSTLKDEDIASRTITGNSIAIGNVGTDEIALNGVAGDEIATAAVGTDEIATNGVGGTEIATAAVGGEEIISGAVGNSEIADSSVRNQEIAFQTLLGEDAGSDAWGTRECNSSSISFVGHTHSSSNFVRYSKGEREAMLADRRELEDAIDAGELTHAQLILAKNTLTALKLHMDYIHMDAYQREEKLNSDPEWAGQYSDHYRVGRWEGAEPLQVLDLDKQDERRIAEVNDPHRLSHVHAEDRSIW